MEECIQFPMFDHQPQHVQYINIHPTRLIWKGQLGKVKILNSYTWALCWIKSWREKSHALFINTKIVFTWEYKIK